MTARKIVFSDDTAPGITRRKIGRHWGYWDADGRRITDRDEIDRLNAIALPPAYRDAWFCPNPRGHIQAIGWDARGRKQYRYHQDFRAAQEVAKYDRCAEFGAALPLIRARVATDLARRSMTRDRASAAVVRLLDQTHIRVGNEAYAKANRSFGATTLRKRHARTSGTTVRLRFRGKGGVDRECALTDRALARFVRACHDLDEQHLFAWLDDAGDAHPVTSTDVNDYIRAATGEDFTAKHFRTWAASAVAFEALATAERDLSLAAMLAPVTQQLGNTPAIARKSYVHPALIDLTRNGQALFRKALRMPRKTRHLSRIERGLIAFLETGAPSAAPA